MNEERESKRNGSQIVREQDEQANRFSIHPDIGVMRLVVVRNAQRKRIVEKELCRDERRVLFE